MRVARDWQKRDPRDRDIETGKQPLALYCSQQQATMIASTTRLLAVSAALCLPASTVAMHRVRLTESGTVDEGNRQLEVDEDESRNLSHFVSFTEVGQGSSRV